MFPREQAAQQFLIIHISVFEQSQLWAEIPSARYFTYAIDEEKEDSKSAVKISIVKCSLGFYYLMLLSDFKNIFCSC